MRIAKLMLVLSFVVVLVGCDFQPNVEEYCVADSMYVISKQPNGFRLHLKVGRVNPRSCASFQWRDRTINLSVDVSSPEEAHKVIDRERERLIKSKLEQPLLPANQK